VLLSRLLEGSRNELKPLTALHVSQLWHAWRKIKDLALLLHSLVRWVGIPMPIKIDLVAELQTALTDPDVRAALSAYIKQAVKEALAERDTDSWLDQKGAAALLGLTIPSFTGKRRRYPELDQMSAGNR
jgi:hypothetical protein